MKLSRSINKVLIEADDDLGILVTTTKRLRYLTSILRNVLPSDIGVHCYVASYTTESLTVLVDSSAWATKLRLLAQQILPQLQAAHSHFALLRQIQVKILNPSAEPPQAQYQKPSMNAQNAKGLTTLAESVDDPALQDALKRLAKRAK